MENILKKAETYGLQLDPDSIQSVNIGLDFQVAFAADQTDKHWVLRLPRRQDAFAKTAQEKATLDLLNAASLPFEIPNWEIYDENLIAYQQLKGEPAVTTDADTQTNHWAFDETHVPDRYIQSLGQALAALHAVPKASPLKEGETSQKLRDHMRARMDKVKESYDIHPDLWARWRNWLNNEDLWPEQAGFIHGDLYPGHTLIAADFSVTGIIDWTEAQVADIANDFTAFYLLFGEEKLAALIQAYQKAGGYTWPAMKEHIMELLTTQAITLAEFAESSGLDEYREIAKQMLAENN